MTRHIGQFSTLRFGAAFWVFLSHVLLIIEKPIPFISEGDLAVDLFIILSGFVITLMLLKRPEPYGGYIFRRFVRLYPLYLVALGLGILTQAYYEPVIGQSLFGAPAVENFGQRVSAVDNNLWQHLGLHLTMMHGAIPDTLLPLASLAFSGPLWSISLEWQFYLIAPFLIWALDLRVPGRWRVAVPVFAAMILSCYLARRYWHADVPSFLPLRLPLFGLGILCGVAWQRVGTTHPAIVIGGSVGSALLLSTIGFRLLPLAMWFAVYIVAGLSDRVRGLDGVNRLLNLKPLIWLGERSYGLYVLHMPIVLFLAYFFILPATSRLNQVTFALALLGIFPVIIAIAAILYRYIEKPAVRWAKRKEFARASLGAPRVTA